MQRIPCRFIAEFGPKLPYYLHLKCNNLMWVAKYDKGRKKMYDLRDFMIYYGLKLYSVILFDYYGDGDFIIKCYNHRATEIIYPTIDPFEFFKTDKAKSLKKAEFIYERDSLEVAKHMICFKCNAMRNIPDDFKLKVNVSPQRQEMQQLVQT